MLDVYRADGVSILLLYGITLHSERHVKYLIPKRFYPWLDTNFLVEKRQGVFVYTSSFVDPSQQLIDHCQTLKEHHAIISYRGKLK